MTSRLYIVRNRKDDSARIVEATNPAQALRYAAEQAYEIAPARPMDVANLMAKGVVVEKAGGE